MTQAKHKMIERLQTEDKLAFKDDSHPLGDTQYIKRSLEPMWSETFEQFVDCIEGESEKGERRVLMELENGKMIDIPARWVESS